MQETYQQSLPPRERGLIYAGWNISLDDYSSLPPRERGLKLLNALETPEAVLSLPPRERGLKYMIIRYMEYGEVVAPSAGAWIEIDIIRI